MPLYVLSGKERMRNVLKLHKSLYGLRDAARILHELLIKAFKSFWLTEQGAAPYIFVDKNMVVLYHLYHILIFTSKKEATENLKRPFEKRYAVKDLCAPQQF